MKTLTTKGIKINVEHNYLIGESNPDGGTYCHSYRITIINTGGQNVKLLRRHWVIRDSNGSIREVKGDGVVGQQPELSPGQAHQYVSWCPLTTPIGIMSGTYQMIDLDSKEEFEVVVPTFNLIYPPKLN